MLWGKLNLFLPNLPDPTPGAGHEGIMSLSRPVSLYLFCQFVLQFSVFSLIFLSYLVFPSEHQNHARELVKKADLSQCDALVIMSGDGLLFEVLWL